MKPRRHQSGLTLVEVLIAGTIFSLISLAAYALVFRAQATHEQLDADVSQQRSVRIALDRMIEALRATGAGINPAGEPSVADERIEGAWESAVFVRADFDGERELLLEGSGPGERPLVTTGNDEIAGFVLGKSGVMPHTITLHADLTGSGGRRDAFIDDDLPAGEETRAVGVSAVTVADQIDPPYQLQRVSFNAAGDVVKEVVAEDIFRLQFRYYDRDGVEIEPASISGADGVRSASRRVRAEIRRIEIDLVGMSERPVTNYDDPFLWSPDPPSARAHRKFPLSATIELDNLASGRDHGPVPSSSLVAPGEIVACPGHCDRLVARWPAVAGVQAYQVLVTSDAVSTVHDVVGETFFVYRAAGVEATFTFAVRSWDPVHNVFSAYSPGVSVVPSHQLPENTPAGVANAPVVVRDGEDYALRVSWERVGANTGSLPPGTCARSDGLAVDPVPPFDLKFIDLGTYEVHRVRSVAGSSFDTTADSRVDDRDLNASPMTALSFIDRLASPCQPYFYRVRALDACEVSGAPSPPMTLEAQFDLPFGVVPAAPVSLGSSPPVEESLVGGAEIYVVNLEWPHVGSTALPDEKPVTVAHYIVERSRRLAGSPGFVYDGRIDVYESNRVADIVPRVVSGREAAYRYVVMAQFDCMASGLRTSEPSPFLEVPSP